MEPTTFSKRLFNDHPNYSWTSKTDPTCVAFANDKQCRDKSKKITIDFVDNGHFGDVKKRNGECRKLYAGQCRCASGSIGT